MSTHISTQGVAVDADYFWRPMKSCPRSAKVQLLNKGGVSLVDWDMSSDRNDRQSFVERWDSLVDWDMSSDRN